MRRWRPIASECQMPGGATPGADDETDSNCGGAVLALENEGVLWLSCRRSLMAKARRVRPSPWRASRIDRPFCGPPFSPEVQDAVYCFCEPKPGQRERWLDHIHNHPNRIDDNGNSPFQHHNQPRVRQFVGLRHQYHATRACSTWRSRSLRRCSSAPSRCSSTMTQLRSRMRSSGTC